MEQFISDSDTDSRMSGLEKFIGLYVGQRQPEFGATEGEVESVEMPAPLQRFFRFAGRWPGHNPRTPFANRFCMQDQLCAIRPAGYAMPLQMMDGLLVFVWENQGVWVAATERRGADPPVWISEHCSHREERKVWRQLEKPLSHFLVSFILQEMMFGSELVAVAPGALGKFDGANLKIEPIWENGQYAWDIDRPSFFFVNGRFLLRHAPREADGDDWYGCNNAAGAVELSTLGLPTGIR
jgi:hypothetical protein